ncbi:transporter substrate-binding domain-containing protein [Pelomonas sp. SE-A7]|uniref:substrate-binding periplasmic protein n=1 Tax=Pelomonas sp. SE-A7 TaxID=3054953 RepID=UPI00259CB8CE|nr:transporter substrate-binding domain-containing protein [Pelomonas sp. SE-A7]MDM4768043.1 transporter substrate-binding domain-containing protein [Pelomonas sp. SE-A7]
MGAMSPALRVLTAALLLANLPAVQARPLTACSEPGDGPPWLYWDKANGKLAGFSADLWPAVFARLGLELRMEGKLPWKRCLRAVALGEVDFAIGAYHDAERAKLLAFSAPYKTLTPQVFYRRSRPLPIREKADLKRYRGCGMNGSSYQHYGLSEKDLDLGSRSYTTLVSKTLLGNCDYFVEELEVMQQIDGGRHHYLDDPELLHAPVPDALAPALHLVTALKGPHVALLPRVDAAIGEMKKSGDYERLWRANAGGLPY